MLYYFCVRCYIIVSLQKIKIDHEVEHVVQPLYKKPTVHIPFFMTKDEEPECTL